MPEANVSHDVLISIAVLTEQVKQLSRNLEDFKRDLSGKYVTVKEWETYRRAFWLVASLAIGALWKSFS